MMAKTMKRLSLFLVPATAFTSVLFLLFQNDVCLTLAITFGTTAYHFVIRLFVGGLYNLSMRNHADYTKWWYRPRPWEERLYHLLRVKSWKGKMPTYDPNIFSPHIHSWDEIAQAMCQSELVHETNMLLSFIPLMGAKWFGEFPVFFITSICGACIDLLFVIMQRYNRPRVVKLIRRKSPKA